MKMARHALLILVGNRKAAAVDVQKTLTAWGCLIKIRLGIHDGVLTDCSEKGLIFCELVGDDDKRNELTRKLNLIKGVCARQITLDLDQEQDDDKE
jgi:hypothetical protein